MILDRGIASVFRRRNTAQAGAMPVYAYDLLTRSCYGELEFAAQEARPNGPRDVVRVDARIRILQDRRITNLDAVALADAHAIVPGETVRYEVARAWHGTDEDSGEAITDLSLTEVGRWS